MSFYHFLENVKMVRLTDMTFGQFLFCQTT